MGEDEDKPKTKKVEKTTWDWVLVNESKPIWTRKPDDIEQETTTSSINQSPKTLTDLLLILISLQKAKLPLNLYSSFLYNNHLNLLINMVHTTNKLNCM